MTLSTINVKMSRTRMERLSEKLRQRVDDDDVTPVELKVAGTYMNADGVEPLVVSIILRLKP